MDFSSLVLMEKDKQTGYVKRELGSFEVGEGALYIKKFYVVDNIVNIYFDTDKDVEEWEYSAIYDYFNMKAFEDAGFEIEEDLEEYNPTYILKYAYNNDYHVMKEKLDKVINIIKSEMTEVFEKIKDKKSEYEE